jgi:hypothetical protein
MPADDLLRFVGEPLAYSQWWLVLGIVGVLAVIGWYVGVYVATRPTAAAADPREPGGMRTWLIRRRFGNEVRGIGERHRRGELSGVQACAELSSTVRTFLASATGVPTQYQHVGEIASSDVPLVAGAAPLLGALTVAQFDPAATADVAALERQAQEVIAAWN